MAGIPEIDLSDPQVLRDPFTAYGDARDRSPLARLVAPGFAGMWALTGHDGARAMLTDPRFELKATSYIRPSVPEHCQAFLRTMQEMDGPEHTRLRGLVSAAFTPRRATGFRSRIEAIVQGLLNDLPGYAEDGVVDLLEHFARPLPIDVICELVGVSPGDRPAWREYGAAIAAGQGQKFTDAIPAILGAAREVVARRAAEPDGNLVSYLLRVRAERGDRLSETELITLVWHLVLAGQTPANLIANAVHGLLTHPGQLDRLRTSPILMPGAVEELTRWCGSQLLTIPRYALQECEIDGVRLGEGDAVTAAIVSANRDPRVFANPDRLDITRPAGPPGHLGYAHGPHFCLGAPLARVQTEVALTGLLRRFPGLALTSAVRAADPGTWRLTSLRLSL
jgi:cytochrome P450